VPTQAIAWPSDRHERSSVNSFGVGGANVHVILDSAASCGAQPHVTVAQPGNRLLVSTANEVESARRASEECSQFIAKHPEELDNVAYTLGMRREYLPYRTFAVTNTKDNSALEFSPPVKTGPAIPSILFVFTGQGAQWPTMGSKLLSEYPKAMHDIRLMELALSTLGDGLSPSWSLSRK
jgi:acyl transferase domain-containing protein